LYKGVIDDNSTAVFNGKVFVRQDAQQINAFQSNRNVLLSDNAAVNSKPELEIYADDVKCSHGSTVSKLNQDQVYYFKSRGINEEQAIKILQKAFLVETLEVIENTQIKEYSYSLLDSRL